MSDNPMAFPSVDSSGNYGPVVHDGMTLRDYFAGQALPAIIAAMQSGIILTHPKAGGGPPGFAASAYDVADALLAARARLIVESG